MNKKKLDRGLKSGYITGNQDKSTKDREMYICKPNKEEKETIRKIAKAHGVKGIRQGRNKHSPVNIGRQTIRIDRDTVLPLISKLKESGFFIAQEDIILSLANKGICDMFSVYKLKNKSLTGN